MYRVKLLVDAVEYIGWTSATITRSLEQTCSSFSLTTTDGAFDKPILTGSLCQIYYDNQLILTGYIDGYTEEYSASSHTVNVTGRSKTQDLVDSSTSIVTSITSGKSPVEIAKELASPFGIDIVAENLTDLKPYQGHFEIKGDGESAYEALHRLAELQQFTITDNEYGQLVLMRITEDTVTNSTNRIIKMYGSDSTNVLSATFNEKANECFTTIIVKGQEKETDEKHGKKATNKHGKAKVESTPVKVDDVAFQ